jgi:sortase (surface protein transpeptidase)
MALDIEYIPEHHHKRWIILIIFIIIVGSAGWFGYKWYTTGIVPFPLPITIADTHVNESSLTSNDINGYKAEESHPRYITIPSINLSNTRVFPVGLNSTTLPALPDNIHDAGWYTKSAMPGSGGVVLIDAYNLGITTNGAFTKLGALKKGDTVIIVRGDGKSFSYNVVDNQTMSLDTVVTSGLSLMTTPAIAGQEGLNLITFDGQWVPKLGTFDKRTIVRAVLNPSN